MGKDPLRGIKKTIDKILKKIAEFSAMAKCPISVVSNFPLAVYSYSMDIIGYLLWIIILGIRFPIIFVLNAIIGVYNYFVRIVFTFMWKLMGQNISIPLLPFFSYFVLKNRVLKWIEPMFPFLGRNTSVMKKCYCASSIRYLFDPLEIKTNSTSDWFGFTKTISNFVESASKSATAKQGVNSLNPSNIAGYILIVSTITLYLVNLIIQEKNPLVVSASNN